MSAHARVIAVAVTAWLGAGVLVGAPDLAAPAAGILTLLAGVSFIVAVRARRAFATFVTVAVCCAMSALIAAATAFAQPARSPQALEDAAGSSVRMEVVIESIPVPSGSAPWSNASRVAFDGVAVAYTLPGREPLAARVPVHVFASTDDGLAVGATVSLEGSLQVAEPGESSAFLLFASGHPAVRAGPPWWQAWAEPLRASFRTAASNLHGDGGALLPGLAIGDTSAVDASLKAAMTASSLSHLTAVSGANCAVIVALVMLGAAALGAPRALRVILAASALAAFVILVTPEPSVVRASVMAAVVLVALMSGVRLRGVVVLSAAVVGILVCDPWLSRSYGFALSTLATGGLLLLGPILARGLARWMPRPLAFAIAIPLAAQIACQPVLILLSPVVPVSGVVANLLAEPAAPLATVLGLLACVCLPVFAPLGELLCRLAWLPAAWIAQIARVVDAAPFGRLPWLGGAVGALLMAVVIGAVLWAARAGARGRSIAAAGLVIIIVAGAYGGALLGVAVTRAITRPADWMFAACDIGQGDAVLVRDDGRVALVDVGPDAAPLERCLDDLGIDRIDLLVLTHYDRDHVGGVEAVIGRVDEAVVGLPETDADRRIVADLAGGGATVRRGVAGMTGVLGRLDWNVIWPAADAATMRTGNDGSVTVVFDGVGIRSIFLGDLGEDSQNALMAFTDVGSVDVVKVAHHGSADQSARLYEHLHARLGLISVGVDNGYGHPTAKLLNLLAASGTVAERTDRQGLVLVAPNADGTLRVWSERSG
jgi:competence protein ComEC